MATKIIFIQYFFLLNNRCIFDNELANLLVALFGFHSVTTTRGASIGLTRRMFRIFWESIRALKKINLLFLYYIPINYDTFGPLVYSMSQDLEAYTFYVQQQNSLNQILSKISWNLISNRCWNCLHMMSVLCTLTAMYCKSSI